MELKQRRVRHEILRDVRRVVLSDPERDNCLGSALLAELGEALRLADADPGCRLIVLAADGNTFCSGLDLQEAFSQPEPPMDLFRAFADCLLRIARTRKPVLSVVQGRAAGGGLGLAAAADIVIATEGAEMSLPEVIAGMIPALVAPVLLRRVPAGRIRAMALGARPIGGAEALAIGLVDEVVSTEELGPALRRQVGRLTRSSPDAIARTKSYLDWLGDHPLETSLDRALAELSSWLRQPHIREGARAFADGFSPPWFSRQEVSRTCPG